MMIIYRSIIWDANNDNVAADGCEWMTSGYYEWKCMRFQVLNYSRDMCHVMSPEVKCCAYHIFLVISFPSAWETQRFCTVLNTLTIADILLVPKS